ncbi:hypothetical protein GOP47_0025091 [Adiantum capillus-veneris]|nr:hypothetical protein GOP47_0025091 [Adiantum capillus-veneris]
MPAASPAARNGEKQVPHAVVMPWPGQGHINPLLHLSKRLAALGFCITFVNTDYSHTRVTQSIQRQQQEEGALAADKMKAPNFNITFVALPDGVPAEETRTCDVPQISRGVVRAAAAFEKLLETLVPPPTCIISDTYVAHTQDAANKFSIPRVSFWTQSAACYAVHAAVAKGVVTLPSGALEANEQLIMNKLIKTVPGLPPLCREDMPGFLQCCDGPDFMFDFCVRPFLRADEAACVVFNSFEVLEGEVIDGLRDQEPGCQFHSIGPVLPAEFFSGSKLSLHQPMNRALAYFPEDFNCLKWLDRWDKGSVLYISFGSLTELTGAELEEFALGLEASGVPLLWVMRPDLLEGGGPGALPEGFEERTKERVMIIAWAPQLHVLAHPAVGAFLTHAGWNSILEGVSQGLPMLGFPYFADQMINCRFIGEVWGNGQAFERQGAGQLTRALVEEKARAIMGASAAGDDDDEARMKEQAALLRQRASQLRDAAREAVSSNTDGSSIKGLHCLLQCLQVLENAESNPHSPQPFSIS